MSGSQAVNGFARTLLAAAWMLGGANSVSLADGDVASVIVDRAPREADDVFVARSTTLLVPDSAFGREGACDLAIASDSALLDVSAYSASGARLAQPAHGALRAHLRITREGALRTYVVVRVSRPTRVRFVFSPTAIDSVGAAAHEPPSPRAELLPVGAAVVASAPRRVAARADELVGAGFRASAVAVLDRPAPLLVPAHDTPCIFVLASVDAGALVLAGVAIAEGSDATLLLCDVNAPLDVVPTRGTPILAFAWLLPTVPDDTRQPSGLDAEPAAIVLRHELASRGFVRLESFELAASPGDAAATLEIPVAATRCVAIAALGRAGRAVDLRLTDARGTFLARSESRAPASRIYHCAARDETLTVWAAAAEDAALPARIVVARESP